MQFPQNKAQEILIRAKKDVFGGNVGSNITTFKGDGLDFKEIAQYNDGDDIRKINWNATAKSGDINDIKINVFNQEQELNIIIVFLVSGSMSFGSVRFKQEIATQVVALLGFSSLKNKNLLQTIFFSDKVEKFYPPTKNEFITNEIVSDMLEFDTLGRDIDYQNLSDYINASSKKNGKKSLIFLVGDFYDYDNKLDLSQISYQNEIYALMIRDRFEEYPYIESEINFIDPINLDSSNISMNKSVAKEYKKLIEKNDTKVKEHFLKHQISYGKIYTDNSFDDVYFELTNILR
jgi:hypothetical protein